MAAHGNKVALPRRGALISRGERVYQHKLALDIVDDPHSSPIDADAFPGLTVVPVTHDEVTGPAAARRLVRKLSRRGWMGAPRLQAPHDDLASLIEEAAGRQQDSSR